MIFGFHFHHGLMMLDLKHRVLICLGFDWFYQRLQGQIFFKFFFGFEEHFGLKRLFKNRIVPLLLCGQNRKLLTHLKRVR